MPYIGNPTVDRFVTPRAASVFSGDGSTTAFTISNAVTTNNAFVFYNGTCMKPTTDYAISGTTLTFTFAPLNASEIMVRYQL